LKGISESRKMSLKALLTKASTRALDFENCESG
jgi:hypothetical protein